VIKEITAGNFGKVFDAGARAHDTAIAALEQVSTVEEKMYSTTNTWFVSISYPCPPSSSPLYPRHPTDSVSNRTPFITPEGVREYRCRLGKMGQDNPLGHKVTAQLASWIPDLEKHIANGAIKPLEYQLVDGKGWEAVIRAADTFENGGAERKLVVRVQDE
jgi:hypothetical protein